MSASMTEHGTEFVPHDETSRKLRVGIGLYVLVDVTLVASLFASYIFLRVYNTQGQWFTGIKAPNTGLLTVLAAILALSAVSYYLAERALHTNNQQMFRLAVVAALVLMAIALVWTVWYMGHLPFTTSDGAFASAFIMLTSYHVLHMIVATLIGIGVVNRAFHGRYSSLNTIGITVIGFFWYWTMAMGVALWLLLLVQPPRI